MGHPTNNKVYVDVPKEESEQYQMHLMQKLIYYIIKSEDMMP